MHVIGGVTEVLLPGQLYCKNLFFKLRSLEHKILADRPSDCGSLNYLAS